jgi:hypothetical protein
MAAFEPARVREVLALDERMQVLRGSPQALRAALDGGADLRIYSEFRHNEHIDTASDSAELIQETMDMRAVYLIDRRWAAGILTLRQPVELPEGFGPRPSLSLFLYNENGDQAIARPFLDGPPVSGPLGPSPTSPPPNMPKYRVLDGWDGATNAPSSNFVYYFDTLRYLVREDWQEVLRHDAEGRVLSGSIEALAGAFAAGAEVKVGIENLAESLADPERDGSDPLPHTVFSQCGSCYYYTERKLLIAGTHPVPRVAPAIPLRYRSGNWDYAWLYLRTDGHAAVMRYDPYTLQPERSTARFGIRWFVR